MLELEFILFMLLHGWDFIACASDMHILRFTLVQSQPYGKICSDQRLHSAVPLVILEGLHLNLATIILSVSHCAHDLCGVVDGHALQEPWNRQSKGNQQATYTYTYTYIYIYNMYLESSCIYRHVFLLECSCHVQDTSQFGVAHRINTDIMYQCI